MKASETLYFSFPEKNPADWELFMSFMKPRSQVRVTKNDMESIIVVRRTLRDSGSGRGGSCFGRHGCQ
jgi:hypothetical protein